MNSVPEFSYTIDPKHLKFDEDNPNCMRCIYNFNSSNLGDKVIVNNQVYELNGHGPMHPNVFLKCSEDQSKETIRLFNKYYGKNKEIK